jgi:sarcosine oxidase delta subunit
VYHPIKCPYCGKDIDSLNITERTEAELVYCRGVVTRGSQKLASFTIRCPLCNITLNGETAIIDVQKRLYGSH